MIRAGFALGGAALPAFAALFAWPWWERRRWIVSRAVDRGACIGAPHVDLSVPTPRAARELFAIGPACRRRIVTMLAAAPHFTCRADAGLTVCEHPLAPDTSTYVRAILGGSHALLVTIPS